MSQTSRAIYLDMGSCYNEHDRQFMYVHVTCPINYVFTNANPMRAHNYTVISWARKTLNICVYYRHAWIITCTYAVGIGMEFPSMHMSWHGGWTEVDLSRIQQRWLEGPSVQLWHDLWPRLSARGCSSGHLHHQVPRLGMNCGENTSVTRSQHSRRFGLNILSCQVE